MTWQERKEVVAVPGRSCHSILLARNAHRTPTELIGPDHHVDFWNSGYSPRSGPNA
jgi:hypothetical protein